MAFLTGDKTVLETTWCVVLTGEGGGGRGKQVMCRPSLSLLLSIYVHKLVNLSSASLLFGLLFDDEAEAVVCSTSTQAQFVNQSHLSLPFSLIEEVVPF